MRWFKSIDVKLAEQEVRTGCRYHLHYDMSTLMWRGHINGMAGHWTGRNEHEVKKHIYHGLLQVPNQGKRNSNA